MPAMTNDQMATFFARTRQGILLTTAADGTAHGVPVWFDWDGELVRFFSGAGAPKIDRMVADGRISMLVTNDVDEQPAWVRFEGRAEFNLDADAQAFAVDVLAPRYWDLDHPTNAQVVEQWRQAPADAFVVVELRPERIVSSG